MITQYHWIRRHNGKKKPRCKLRGFLFLAERTGLEPATSAVTGLRSNQLSYRSKKHVRLSGAERRGD